MQFEKDSLTEYIEDLRVHNLISTTDGKKLKENFSETNRSYLNMIPGFQVTYDWPLSEVIELEDKDMLEATLIEALQFCLSTWGEEISTINSVVNQQIKRTPPPLTLK